MGQFQWGLRVLIFGILMVTSLKARAENTAICVDIALQDLQNETTESRASDVSAEIHPETSPVSDTPNETVEGMVNDGGAPQAEVMDGERQATSPPMETPAPPPGSDENEPPAHPHDQTSILYLKRLMEHYVTHQPGYIAVETSCKETIRVELYPLTQGWTVFVRYSGTGREERVDALFPDELSQFAERAVLAVLNDVSISETINRENVLKADSMRSVQRIRGTNHFVLSVGTQLRGGRFRTAIEDSARGTVGEVEKRIRVVTPFTTSLGYRGRFENWGLEAMAILGIGTNKTAVRKNPAGGHIDFGGGAGFGIHFLRYFDPRGLISFYMGAGSTFELLWFSAVKAAADRDKKDRSYMLSGGLDVDLVFGWEFMRASAVQFLLQGEVNLPAYVAKSENNHGTVDTWFPGISVKLGIIF